MQNGIGMAKMIPVKASICTNCLEMLTITDVSGAVKVGLVKIKALHASKRVKTVFAKETVETGFTLDIFC